MLNIVFATLIFIIIIYVVTNFAVLISVDIPKYLSRKYSLNTLKKINNLSLIVFIILLVITFCISIIAFIFLKNTFIGNIIILVSTFLLSIAIVVIFMGIFVSTKLAIACITNNFDLDA